jgi:membrane protease subunit HflK
MRDIYANSTKIFVSGKAGSSVVNLSLDKLLEAGRRASSEAAAPAAPASGSSGASSAPAAQVPAQPNPASQAAAASDVLRSRDSLRSSAREDDLQQ